MSAARPPEGGSHRSRQAQGSLISAAPRPCRAWRAIVGAAWALAWTMAWGGALLVFASLAQAEPLTLGVSPGPVSLPIYVAESRGFFEDEGLALRLRDCTSGRECHRWLAEGSVDVATAAELAMVTGVPSPRALAIIATISTSSYQIKLVARRSARIAEAPQIRGKRVGTVIGSSAQYFLDNWLVYNDIDPASVAIVALAPDGVAKALDERAVDAVAIWEPIASTAALLLGGDAVVFASPRVYTQYFNLVAARATIAARQADIQRLLRALIRAQDFIRSDPQAARALLTARLHLPAAIVAAVVDNQDYRVRLDQSLVTTLQSEARWAARRAGAAHATVDVLGTIDPAPLRRLDPAAVGLAK
jgi:NitT/TauT family transport system substrate-binding protein